MNNYILLSEIISSKSIIPKLFYFSFGVVCPRGAETGCPRWETFFQICYSLLLRSASDISKKLASCQCASLSLSPTGQSELTGHKYLFVKLTPVFSGLLAKKG